LKYTFLILDFTFRNIKCKIYFEFQNTKFTFCNTAIYGMQKEIHGEEMSPYYYCLLSPFIGLPVLYD